MAHAASQLKKKADENLNAAEDEKEKKKARKRSREVKKKVEEFGRRRKGKSTRGMGAGSRHRGEKCLRRASLVESGSFSFVMMQPPL